MQTTKENQKKVKSFMISDELVFGDLLSTENRQTEKKLKIGLVDTGCPIVIFCFSVT